MPRWLLTNVSETTLEASATAFPCKAVHYRFSSELIMQVIAAQQYNLTMKGYAPLLKWVNEHMQQLHGPPGTHDTVILGGSNYTLEVCCSACAWPILKIQDARILLAPILFTLYD